MVEEQPRKLSFEMDLNDVVGPGDDVDPLLHLEKDLESRAGREPLSHLIAYWALGLLNNAPFVILNASAKDLLPEAVGGFYLANSIPSLCVRLSAPYWFDLVTYRARMIAASLLMGTSFILLRTFSDSKGLLLCCVALMSVQSGLGETTLLSLSSRYESNKTLTAWSSGTGIAGVFGYVYVIVLRDVFKWTTEERLGWSSLLAFIFIFAFYNIEPVVDSADSTDSSSTQGKSVVPMKTNLSWKGRLQLTAKLWPWTIPLLVVYWAEYAMQSGIWVVVEIDGYSSDDFYLYSNLCYQVGVFFSRSSGMVWQPDTKVLWLMPAVQTAVLAFFIVDINTQIWYDRSLFGLAIFVGLLGGWVYVNGFRLIIEGEKDDRLKELSTASAAVFSDLGCNLGEATGLLLQKLLNK